MFLRRGICQHMLKMKTAPGRLDVLLEMIMDGSKIILPHGAVSIEANQIAAVQRVCQGQAAQAFIHSNFASPSYTGMFGG